jgi:prolyl-tRNA synthetase
MRMSKLLAPTLRENPAEAEVVSHQLLMRAGYIRRLASGIYNYLPLMWRVIKKVEEIVREEMNRAGAQELLMPILQPADIWIESGRWEVYGKELIRLKDRHSRDCVLGPTNEEVITTIAKNEIHSYRQLPVNLYQIQNKYRDEIRPRFGLLRGREFIMKDAYSFHTSEEDLDREYQVMAETYKNIFKRCGLETRMVRSDSGAIGGDVSHEFMVLTHTHSGECDVYYCGEVCDYAANANRAESILPKVVVDGSAFFPEEQVVETPNCDTIEALCNFLKIPPSLICKTLLYIKDEKEPVMVLIRGDLEIEETKLLNALGAYEIRMANAEEIAQYTGTQKGYVGLGEGVLIQNEDGSLVFGRHVDCPPSTKEYGTVFIDHSIKSLSSFVIALNKTGYHKVGYNWPDPQLLEGAYRDLKLARVGDTCPECQKGTLEMTRGIEVGNIFKLGQKYSKMMNATYSSEQGTEEHFIMGCYGIGVSRTAAAAVERYHDENGIIWPLPIAPYHVVVVPVNTGDEVQMKLAEQVYEELQAAGVEVVIDDRDERAGVKFKDADLMGFPIRMTIGKKAAENLVEVKLRAEKNLQDIPAGEVVEFVQTQLQSWRPEAVLAHV